MYEQQILGASGECGAQMLSGGRPYLQDGDAPNTCRTFWHMFLSQVAAQDPKPKLNPNPNPNPYLNPDLLTDT